MKHHLFDGLEQVALHCLRACFSYPHGKAVKIVFSVYAFTAAVSSTWWQRSCPPESDTDRPSAESAWTVWLGHRRKNAVKFLHSMILSVLIIKNDEIVFEFVSL